MDLKKFTLITLGVAFMVLTLIHSSSASRHQNARTQPRRIFTYYHHEATCELEAALYELVYELERNPDAQGHIILYLGYNNTGGYFRKHTPSGVIHRQSLGVRRFLTGVQKVSPNRITITFGGKRETFQGDVWVTPKGALPPEPTPAPGPDMPVVEEQFLLDEYLYFPDSASDIDFYHDPAVRLDGFAKALLKESHTVGYIIGYAERRNVEEWGITKDGKEGYLAHRYQVSDRRGTGKRIAASEKSNVSRLFGVKPSRVVTIDGGYRNSRMIELWIVPNEGKLPQPTPTYPRGRNR